MTCLLWLSSSSSPAFADQHEFFDLTLDELLELEVTSVSKSAEPLSTAAAAISVITAEDIARAGITSLPEALRLAPGMEVAQIDGNKWAVSARGYNARFSNKLLVLIDGRDVYSPVFSGVFWDAQDLILEDVERIEVIRGPGATLWGANAVNGVINIVTRPANETQGGLVSAGLGNQERGFVSARWGGRLGDIGAYRMFAKHFDRAGNRLAGGGRSADEWYQSRLGFRVDATPTRRHTLFLSGELFDGDSGEMGSSLGFEPPYHVPSPRSQPLEGFNLNARWDYALSDVEDLRLQAYVEKIDRDWEFVEIERETKDISAQISSTRLMGHELIAGITYRVNEDDIGLGAEERVVVDPETREEEVISIFAQDDIALIPDRVGLTVGSKFEYNDFTGWEIQPSVRVSWRASEVATLWAAVSRAVRTPGRIDRDSITFYGVREPASVDEPPIAAFVAGNRQAEGEDLVAYEAGLRLRPAESLFLDFAAYYNDYDDVRGVSVGPLACLPAGAPFPACLANGNVEALSATLVVNNEVEAESYGLEASLEWRPTDSLRLQSHFSFFEGNETPDAPLTPGDVLDTSPRHQASLRLGYTPVSGWDLDLWLRHVGNTLAYEGVRIPAYTTADLRAAWRPTPAVELSVVGKNLFDDAQAQFLSEPPDVPLTEIRRSVYLQLRYDF